MRTLIYAINITLDGCVDHTKTIGSDEILSIIRNSCERSTCSSMGVRPIS